MHISRLHSIPMIYFRANGVTTRLMVFDRMEGRMHVHRAVATYGYPGYRTFSEVFPHSILATRQRNRGSIAS